MSVNGNKYVRTTLFQATKYPDTISIKDLNLKLVTHPMIQFFSKMGFPQKIQSDLGMTFTSELMAFFFEKCDIKVRFLILLSPEDFVDG